MSMFKGKAASILCIASVLLLGGLLLPDTVSAEECEPLDHDSLRQAVAETRNVPPNLDNDIYVLERRMGAIPVEFPLYMLPWVLSTTYPSSSFHWEQPLPDSWVLVQSNVDAMTGAAVGDTRYGFQMIEGKDGKMHAALFGLSVDGQRRPEIHYDVAHTWSVIFEYIKICQVPLGQLNLR